MKPPFRHAPSGLVGAAALLVGTLTNPYSAAAQDRWVLQCNEAAAATRRLVERDCSDQLRERLEFADEQLEAITEWLLGLDFAEPVVEEQDDGRLIGRVIREESDASSAGFNTKTLATYQVRYNTSWADSEDPHLYLGGWILPLPGDLDGATADEAETLVDRMGTPAHEIFHGVQVTEVGGPEKYRALGQGQGVCGEYDWLMEGSAEAVGLAWVTENPPASGAAHGDVWNPYYLPLTSCEEVYGRSHFWLKVGEEIGSRARIAYLRDVFDSGRDLTVERGVRGVHEALLPHHDGGLYDLYPLVIARHTNDLWYYEGADQSPEVPKVELQWSVSELDVVTRDETVEPLSTNAYDVELSIPEGETVAFIVELAKELRDDPDLHLIIGDERYDVVDSGESERNVVRSPVTGTDRPQTAFVRLANIAPSPEDSRERNYVIRFALEPLDPCEREAMDLAVNYDFQLMPLQAGAFATTGVETASKPGKGELHFSGLVDDGGSACVNPIVVYSLTRERPNRAPTEDAMDPEEAAEKVRQRVNEIAQSVFGKNMDEVTEEDLENMSEEQQRRFAEELHLGDTPSWREKEGDVVIPIFSPHTQTWQGQALMPGPSTRHEGFAGWQPNAAALINIQLPGTDPADLQEGGTYPAEASTFDPAAPPGPDILKKFATRLSFYTSWEGQWVDDCGEPGPLEGMLQGMVEQMNREMAADGEEPLLDSQDVVPGCQVGGWARTLLGDLSGNVTIDEITGVEVRGRFQLSGEGTLRIGDEAGERERNGPITVEGRFSMPTEHIAFDSDG